jgi:MoxR-like ATPase
MDRKLAVKPQSNVPVSEADVAEMMAGVERWRAAIAARYLGHPELVEQLLCCALSGGHALIEGVPGLGKTTLVKAFAAALDLSFARVQFTPDLMPGDVLGGRILEEDEQGRRTLRFEPGPIFAHVVLADEINRAGPRTQSALLEAMAEGQVTSFGETRALPDPFLLVATQNPIEMEGTYPLPEAQLDRFQCMLRVPAPDLAELTSVLGAASKAHSAQVAPVASAADLQRWRGLVAMVPCSSEMLDFSARIVLATAPHADRSPTPVQRAVRHGSSPRGGIALLATARARALIRGRLHVSREDIAAVAAPCLRHRLILSYEGQAELVERDALVQAAVDFAASQGEKRSKSGLD